jgi:ubiquinone biosynthesis protein
LEAQNAETLAREMTHRPMVIFQTVYWPYTSHRVLTTMRIHGFKITDLSALDAANVDRKQVAVNLANSLLEQILLYGLFHGDPHPGNLLVTPDGHLAFLDTGMVGRLDRKTRELLIELAVSIFDQDIDAIVLHLQQLGVVREIADLPSLRRDLARLITKYYFLPRKELRLGELLQRVNYLLFEHNIRMAYEFGLLTKSLFLAEGIALKLDPDFDYNEAARPVIDEVKQRYYSLHTFLEDAQRELRGLRRQLVDLPRRLNKVLSFMEQGVVHVKTTDATYEAKQAQQMLLVNRAIIAALTIGLLIAASVLLAAHPTGWIAPTAVIVLIADSIAMLLFLLALLTSRRF